MKVNKVMKEILKPSKYSLKDLLNIRDALAVLYFYDLADKDLFIEVLKYIKQKEEK